MDKLKSISALKEARSTIDEMIDSVKYGGDGENGSRKCLIAVLAVLGALLLAGVAAYLVYRHMCAAREDEFDDIDSFFDGDDEELYDDEDLFEEDDEAEEDEEDVNEEDEDNEEDEPEVVYPNDGTGRD